MNDRLRINAPAVVSETIDGEAVIMNLKSGNYYSTDKVGSEVWNWIEKGWRRQAMLDALAAMYASDRAQIETVVGAFLDDLTAQGLVVPDDAAGPEPANADAPAGEAGKQTFVAPRLNVYTDMKDLLLLDPIHDVDEVGWPTPKPPSP